MITNKLSKRLQCIANLVDGKRVADIGCDHGKVINYLFSKGNIEYAICSDISNPSVNKAMDLLLLNNVSQDRFDIRCGDGLQTISKKDNIDTAIIAGMGGREIIHILSNEKQLPNILILAPQHNEIEVKKYVLSIGYAIVYDKIVAEDNKYYVVMKAKKDNNTDNLDEFDIMFGKDNFGQDNEDFARYLQHLTNKYESIKSKVDVNNRLEVNNMLNLINRAKDLLGGNK